MEIVWNKTHFIFLGLQTAAPVKTGHGQTGTLTVNQKLQHTKTIGLCSNIVKIGFLFIFFVGLTTTSYTYIHFVIYRTFWKFNVCRTWWGGRFPTRLWKLINKMRILMFDDLPVNLNPQRIKNSDDGEVCNILRCLSENISTIIRLLLHVICEVWNIFYQWSVNVIIWKNSLRITTFHPDKANTDRMVLTLTNWNVSHRLHPENLLTGSDILLQALMENYREITSKREPIPK